MAILKSVNFVFMIVGYGYFFNIVKMACRLHIHDRNMTNFVDYVTKGNNRCRNIRIDRLIISQKKFRRKQNFFD